MKRSTLTPAPLQTGYAAPLGDGLTAYAHADGGLSLEHATAGALDLSPAAAAQLADLLGMAGALRAAARRRRARALYQQRHPEEV